MIILGIISTLCYLSWRRDKALCYLSWRRDKGIDISTRECATRLSTSQISVQFGSRGYGFGTGERKDHDLPLLSFSGIVIATNNFSADNKIGEGGYGPVYKGKLLGHEVAVKRLSKKSGQGFEEFMNEVRSISQLQHNNLVRLFGYCVQCKEKILVYEFMENRSLDSFIFDTTKRKMLDWRRRVTIIEGIAQGVLYLHKYSRLRIIHRDLKTSNILLDNYMNPKISDFGMARIVDMSNGTKTRRIVGTYGYMSPEYALYGQYSTKSDVFSFGVIMLEIISGRKNTMFYETNRSLNLLGYAWEMWKDCRCMEFIDPTLANSYLPDELVLCIQVALLCIQEHVLDRPAISDVVLMLSRAGTSLPMPKQPAFTTNSGLMDTDLLQKDGELSCKDATFSGLTEGR